MFLGSPNLITSSGEISLPKPLRDCQKERRRRKEGEEEEEGEGKEGEEEEKKLLLLPVM